MAARVQTHFDAEVDKLDFNITSKLAAARHRALAELPESRANAPSLPAWLGWQSLAGSVAALSLAIFLVVKIVTPEQAVSVSDDAIAGVNVMEDLQLLSASDDIEFFQSMEFLEWMESNSG